MSICFVVAAFNEARVISQTCQTIADASPGAKIVVIDDGSKDSTFSAASKCSGVSVLRHPINLGQGAALQTGIKYALSIGSEYIVTFDADGQHSVEDALNMVELLRQTPSIDLVLGSRFLSSDLSGIPKKKIVTLRLAILFTRWTTGLDFTDTHNGLRVFRSSLAQSLNITQNGMAHASEILDWVAAKNIAFKEYPTKITYSEYSIAKGQKISNSLNILWDLFTRKMKQ